MKRRNGKDTKKGERQEKSGFLSCLKEIQRLLMLSTDGFTNIESKYEFCCYYKMTGRLKVFFFLISELKQRRLLPRAPTSIESCFSLICLDATKLVLLSVFTLKETICPKIWLESLPKNAISPLPVDVRRSKTSLLKRPILGSREAFHVKVFRFPDFPLQRLFYKQASWIRSRVCFPVESLNSTFC